MTLRLFKARKLRRIIGFFLKNQEGSIKQKAFKGGFWVFSLRIIKQSTQILRVIILAQLLSPKDFGLTGISFLAISIIENFTHTGVQAALVQKNNRVDNYLNAAWTIQLFRGIIIFLSLFFGAPLIALFFNEPNVIPLIRVLSFSQLFRALINIKIVYLQKELDFSKQFFYQLAGTITELIVSLFSAIILRNAWALILGALAGNLVRLVTSYLIIEYHPKLCFERKKLMNLWTYGKWVFASSVLLFIVTQGDDFFVGKVLGTVMLGFYQMAYQISSIPATEITHIVSNVAFPVYAKLQSELGELRNAYYKNLFLISIVSFPIAGGIFILSKEFVPVFLGREWIPIIPTMRILSILGAVRAIAATMGPIFNAMGRPDYNLKVPFIKMLLQFTLIFPLSKIWGLPGVALACVLPSFFSQSYSLIKLKKIINISYKKFFSILLPPSLITILMCIVIFSINFVIENNLVKLFSSVSLGFILYSSLIIFYYKQIKSYDIFRDARMIFKS